VCVCVCVCVCVREREREMYNMVIWLLNFFSLLLVMAALQIKCFSKSLIRNNFFNCPELLFFKGMTGALAPFNYLVVV
jgi:hypothetical protein